MDAVAQEDVEFSSCCSCLKRISVSDLMRVNAPALAVIMF